MTPFRTTTHHDKGSLVLHFGNNSRGTNSISTIKEIHEGGAIPDDYIIFLQEHEIDAGIVKILQISTKPCTV